MNEDSNYRRHIRSDSLEDTEKRGAGLSELEVRRMIQEENKKNKKKFPWLRVLALMLIAALVGSGATALFLSRDRETLVQEGPQGRQVIEINEETNVENAVAQKTTPSVVGITTLAMEENILFQQGQLTEGVGSGVIVSEDGYILTNSHVVRDGTANSIEVIFADGEKASAELLWNDPTLDLAVIKTDFTGLTPVEVADSDEVHVGDKSIAIGNPLGMDLQSTLTSGYISGLNRSITLQTGMQIDGLIQTDAAINPGNSGGALLNSKGELIGINTAKAGSGEGIGFAIPINIAMPIIDQIISEGSYEPVLLGISGLDVARYTLAVGQELPVEEGVVVMEVQDGSPAAEAGINRGDVILGIDDYDTPNMHQLKIALITHKPGDEVEVRLQKGNAEETVNLRF